MAKRDKGNAPGTTEQRVLAFAEELGRIAGTFQAKAEGWLELVDQKKLNQQIASVRDGAAELLEHFGEGMTKATKKKAPAASAPAAAKGRSGGAVDAPGKKHRKPAPSDPRAKRKTPPEAKLRAAQSMVKTPRRGGRG